MSVAQVSVMTATVTATPFLPVGHTLPNGSIAGIVVPVTLFLILLTFLTTFFCMRRRSKAARSSQATARQSSDGNGVLNQPLPVDQIDGENAVGEADHRSAPVTTSGGIPLSDKNYELPAIDEAHNHGGRWSLAKWRRGRR